MVSKTRTPIGAITSSCAASCRERPAQVTQDYEHGRDFITDLEKFLGQLPKGWPYGVEMRNRNWLKPEYFDCLARHRVAHVFKRGLAVRDSRMNITSAMPPRYFLDKSGVRTTRMQGLPSKGQARVIPQAMKVPMPTAAFGAWRNVTYDRVCCGSREQFDKWM